MNERGPQLHIESPNSDSELPLNFSGSTRVVPPSLMKLLLERPVGTERKTEIAKAAIKSFYTSALIAHSCFRVNPTTIQFTVLVHGIILVCQRSANTVHLQAFALREDIDPTPPDGSGTRTTPRAGLNRKKRTKKHPHYIGYFVRAAAAVLIVAVLPIALQLIKEVNVNAKLVIRNATTAYVPTLAISHRVHTVAANDRR